MLLKAKPTVDDVRNVWIVLIEISKDQIMV